MNSRKLWVVFSMVFIGQTLVSREDAKIAKAGMEGILIAQATAEDIPHIASVHHASWQAEFAELLPSEVVEKMSSEFCVSFWREYFKRGDVHAETYVAKIGTHVVGFMAIIKHKDELDYDCEIDKIYVSPQYQGRRIGSRLSNAVFDILRKEGCKKALVKVFIKNEKAQRFYERLGGVYIKVEEILDYHSTITVKVYTFAL